MTVISADGRFEWDSDKNEANVKKHGLAFGDVIPVFDDPLFLELYDSEHSSEKEDRYFGIGTVQNVLVVATSYIEMDRIRIISARVASPKEREVYERRWKDADSRRD